MTQKDFTMSKLNEIEALYKNVGKFDLQDVQSLIIDIIEETWKSAYDEGWQYGYDDGYNDGCPNHTV